MKILNTKEEWEEIKELFRQLYHLQKNPDWTKEKQLALNEKINSMTRIG